MKSVANKMPGLCAFSMFVSLLFVLSASFGKSDANSGPITDWYQADAVLPTANVDMCGNIDESSGNIWIIGGWDENNHQLSKYDINNDTMTNYGSNALSTYIHCYNNANGFRIDNYLYVLGIRFGRLDLKTQDFETYDNSPYFEGLSCLLGSSSKSLLYAVGPDSMLIYDIKLNEWSNGTSPSFVNGVISCIKVDSYIYVLGLSTFIERININSLEKGWEYYNTSFTQESERECQCPSYKHIRNAGITWIHYNNNDSGKEYIYVLGGICQNINNNTGISDVTYFRIDNINNDTQTIKVEKGASLPIGVFGALSVRANTQNQIYLVGGAPGPGNGTNTTYYSNNV